MHWLYLLAAIGLEVIGTSALQASAQFTRLGWSALVVVCYGAAFYLLSLALRVIPVGISYGIWSGLGIVLISLVGWLVFKQSLDLPALIGLGLIVAGVLVINLFSATVPH